MDNIIVTGGTRGLGLAIARSVATRGYRAIAIGRRTNHEFNEAIQSVSEGGHGELVFKSFDFENIEKIGSFVMNIRSEHGPIFGLINNAGISAEGVLATLPNANIEQMIRINTLAPIILTKYVVRGMMSASRGRIINISSIVASTGYRALSAYAATKASLIGMTKSLSREVGPLNITVNAIAPGFLRTQLTESLDDGSRNKIIRRSALRRLADVEDVAETVCFLLGDSGKNITGSVFTIDAGSTA